MQNNGDGKIDLNGALGDLQNNGKQVDLSSLQSKDGDGKIDLNGALGDLQNNGKQVDLSSLQSKDGSGNIDLSSFQGKNGKQVDVNAALDGTGINLNNFKFG